MWFSEPFLLRAKPAVCPQPCGCELVDSKLVGGCGPAEVPALFPLGPGEAPPHGPCRSPGRGGAWEAMGGHGRPWAQPRTTRSGGAPVLRRPSALLVPGHRAAVRGPARAELPVPWVIRQRGTHHGWARTPDFWECLHNGLNENRAGAQRERPWAPAVRAQSLRKPQIHASLVVGAWRCSPPASPPLPSTARPGLPPAWERRRPYSFLSPVLGWVFSCGFWFGVWFGAVLHSRNAAAPAAGAASRR